MSRFLRDYREQRAYKEVTPAQLRALVATQIELVPAPAAGYYLEFLSAHFWLNYSAPAHAAPTNAGDDLSIRYEDGAGAEVANLEATGFINAGADAHYVAKPLTTAIVPASAKALVLDNKGAAEFTGTGAGILKIEVIYRVRAIQPTA